MILKILKPSNYLQHSTILVSLYMFLSPHMAIMQRWAARFVKRDNRCKTSASSILTGLGWTHVRTQKRKPTSRAVQSNSQPCCHPHRQSSPSNKIQTPEVQISNAQIHSSASQLKLMKTRFFYYYNLFITPAADHPLCNTPLPVKNWRIYILHTYIMYVKVKVIDEYF